MRLNVPPDSERGQVTKIMQMIDFVATSLAAFSLSLIRYDDMLMEGDGKEEKEEQKRKCRIGECVEPKERQWRERE